MLAITLTALFALDLPAGDGLSFEHAGTLGFALLGVLAARAYIERRTAWM